MCEKYTPDPYPWFIKAYEDEHSVEIKGRDGYALVATVHWNDGERDANAKLIVAAPELYEALKVIVAQIHAQEINFGPLTADAEEAIRKATA
ncbi:MAG: hypothetical protein QM811_06815 [Pirellulales bacterium]